MIRIPADEVDAIKMVIEAGKKYGYGNLITHLQTVWAAEMMKEYGFTETQAREASFGPGYPFGMQRDIIELGAYDETGERYINYEYTEDR